VGLPGRGLGSARFWLHLGVLLVFLSLWTWKLLEPHPVPDAVVEQLGDLKLLAAKSLHACAYAFLAVLAVSLPVPSYWRWYLAGLLAFHGVATEIGQTFVPGRTGSVRDVLIDWTGVGAGLLVWRKIRHRIQGGAP
jgi:VanZ family protein